MMCMILVYCFFDQPLELAQILFKFIELIWTLAGEKSSPIAKLSGCIHYLEL